MLPCTWAPRPQPNNSSSCSGSNGVPSLQRKDSSRVLVCDAAGS
jgi:hypothetical protein